MSTSTLNAGLAGNSARPSFFAALVAWFTASAKPVAGTWADGAFGM